jgi:hypothetical protein
MKRTGITAVLAMLLLSMVFPAYAGEDAGLGEGVTVIPMVVSDDVSMEITACPAYGDTNAPYPYVHGRLTKGEASDYKTITLVSVNGSYYGKKPFNNQPLGVIANDGTFSVQFSSNDGVGTDELATEILIFLVESGYKDKISPDVGAGYIIPSSQIEQLTEECVCSVLISRE